MDGFGWNLLLAAMAVAFTHTLLGPDHYLPFVALARARQWSRRRTAGITLLCGTAHVIASLLLCTIGLVMGAGLAQIEGVEGGRGPWAAWGLVAVGAAYALWGTRRALRRSSGLTPHDHGGHLHLHRHGHRPHTHATTGRESPVTFWALLVVFILGPCEPLIPLFVLPASRGRWGLAALAALLFGVVTVATMVAATVAMHSQARRLRLGGLERWTHAMAGGVLMASGLAVLFLGL